MRFPTRNPNPVTGPFLEYVSITRSDALTKAGRRNLNLKLWIWLDSQCVELTIRTVHRQWVGRAILHPLCRAIEGPSLVCGAFLAAELDRRDFFWEHPRRACRLCQGTSRALSRPTLIGAAADFRGANHELDAGAPASKRRWRRPEWEGAPKVSSSQLHPHASRCAFTWYLACVDQVVRAFLLTSGLTRY